ncbi:SDR family NAD(P)-dependent oxidoreductase [Paracoccus aminophilus]|uniref:Short chain dehydrogenase/reductase n=1 Tax=Paracoccus aminophilus JCM 7686 TaxID=1367847 RepID=S5XT19_PARAH|nr:SDR family oxidoreductase [Paracoccus aminophilus]AGT10604.1 short chain dehydrogenase/reductase [Paracoccus aminophilus JCM 7686]
MTGVSLSARLEGRVIFLTGAASGIGAAIARRCVAEGAAVICADLNGAAVEALADELGAQGLGVTCDVTEAASVEAAVAAGLARFGRLDGLVHNAAAPSPDGSVLDLTAAQWASEIGVNLTGAFLTCKSAFPAMIAAGGGSAVMIASQFAQVATAKSVAYCAAKAGLVHLAKAMAVDHAADGIRVNSLSPGAVATSRLLQRWPDLAAADEGLGPDYLLGRIGQPDEIAAAAAFLLSPDASFVTGTDLLADGGYAVR